jgi:hypothetical protein
MNLGLSRSTQILLDIASGDVQGLSRPGNRDYFTRSMKVRSTVFTRILWPASM